MASLYPGALDVFDAPGSTLAGPPTHESLHTALNDAVAAIQAVLGTNPGKRQTFTPALTATTTNPTLGTGSAVGGGYSRVGDRVEGEAFIAFGTSGVNAGSGNYRVSLPINPVSANPPYRNSGTPGNASIVGTWQIRDSSGASTLTGVLQIVAGGDPKVMLAYDNNNQVTNALPWIWSNDDVIAYQFAYFAA